MVRLHHRSKLNRTVQMEEQLTQQYIDAILPEILRRAPREPLFFLQSLKIPSGQGPKRFRKVIQPFQLEAFQVMMKSLSDVANWNKPERRRIWIERTKKASKDSDIAAALCWLMAFCERPVKVQVVAANYNQASIIENRAVELLYYNPWLRERVEIVKGEIRRKDRKKEIWTHIEATNTGREAHGETPDVLVLNELVHVAKWDVMETHMNNADGVPQGIVIVATNAGIKGSAAWKWRINALEKGSQWWAQIWHKVAPWINDEDVEEARRRDPIGAQFARLWRGEWISGAGGALTEADIDAVFVRKGPTKQAQRDWVYLGGLDLGVSKDHAGVVIVGVNKKLKKLRVARIRGFAPSLEVDGKREVDGDLVKRMVLKLGKLFRVIWFGYDPAAGGSFMAQDLRRAGLNMVEVKFGRIKCQTEMATTLVQLLKAKLLEAYEDKEGRMRRDFGKFGIEHRPPSGYKLTAVSDEFGHADVGIALAMLLPRAVLELGGWEALLPGDKLADVIETDWNITEEEVDDLPEELRELYEVEEEFGENSYLKDSDNWI